MQMPLPEQLGDRQSTTKTFHTKNDMRHIALYHYLHLISWLYKLLDGEGAPGARAGYTIQSVLMPPSQKARQHLKTPQNYAPGDD